jgi:hypothetical protein
MAASQAPDARWSDATNLKRRLALLRYHASQRDPVTGKSLTAVRGGRSSWSIRAERAGGDRILATELALKRWYPKDFSQGD